MLRQRWRFAIVAIAMLAGCTATPSSTPRASDRPVSSTPPSATFSATATPATTVAAAATATPRLAPSGWVEVFSIDSGSLGDLIQGPEGLLAAGCESHDGELCSQAVVASRDGTGAWHATQVEGPADVYFDGLHRVGDRLFAIGYGHYGPDGGAVVWTSRDGRSWSRVESTSFRGRAIDDIIESPRGTFAIGHEAPIDSDNTSGFLIWPIHGDGSFGDAGVVSAPHREPFALGAIWAGQEFLAWGTDRWNAAPTTLLASPDGTAWTYRADIAGRKTGVVGEIVAAGDRLIAVGQEGTSFPLTPRAWTSTDAGRCWRVADVAGGAGAMDEVAFEGSTYIARGVDLTGDTVRLLAWTSKDGSTWRRLPADENTPAIEGFTVRGRATSEGRTCVSGTFFEEDPTRGAIYCRSA
jgi:hypothetical protein